jgi:HK97 family phage major capsid protein
MSTPEHRVYGRTYRSAAEIAARLAEIDQQHPGQRYPKDLQDEVQALRATLGDIDADQRLARLRGAIKRGDVWYEAGTDGDDHRRAAGEPDAPVIRHAGGSTRARALAANERAEYLPDAARAHMERMLRQDDDPDERLARYVAAMASRDYFRAFAAWVRDPIAGGHEWTDAERRAVQEMHRLQRSMVLGTGSAGGFLVPYELDPNVIIAGQGYVDPMRAVARVETTAVNEKRFVTSTGVSTAWYDEEAEVADHSPALLQPVIRCRKAMSFVPVSFELYEDSSIAQQIGALFADAKATEEARVFTLGTGTTEPRGVVTAVAAVPGSVLATGTNALANGDVYANQSALPARWRPNARFMANLAIINGYRQLLKASGLTESLVDDSGPAPRMAGWELRENSNMDGTLTATANDFALLSGDFRQYAIVDRIGATLEVVPHLFGPNRRPTGQRGFLMHWRVGADVLVPDAFRLTNYNG